MPSIFQLPNYRQNAISSSERAFGNMAFIRSAARQMDRVARRFGYRVFPDWAIHASQIEEIESADRIVTPLVISVEAAQYLRSDAPRLLEFRQLYRELDPEVKTPLLWTEKFTSAPDLTRFRGDNMWVHQSQPEPAYVLTTYYILANDRLGLMQKLTEDGAFGAVTFEVSGFRVSRDLLDSILEIDFVDRHLHLGSRNVTSILDIGSGYGRLAHRMLAAFPSLTTYLCTDVVAESSFVCEYYLRFRGLHSRFELAPATEIEGILKSTNIDLAINVHSFSECTLQAVKWWLDKLALYGVRHLVIVPNEGNHGGQLLRNNAGQDMLPVVERSGYRLIVRESKYADPKVQKYALNPTYYWLFERV